MARINVSNGSSRRLHTMILATILAFLSSWPMANCADNKTSILNGSEGDHVTSPVFLRCSFHSDTYRFVEPQAKLLQPGETKFIDVNSAFYDVKQVQCIVTRWFSNGADRKSTMKLVVWSSAGPSQTAWKIVNGGVYFAIPPNLNDWQGTSVGDGSDVEYYYIPSFLKSSVSSVDSPSEES